MHVFDLCTSSTSGRLKFKCKTFCMLIKWPVSPGFKRDAKSSDKIPTFDEYGSKNWGKKMPPYFFFLLLPPRPFVQKHVVWTQHHRNVFILIWMWWIEARFSLPPLSSKSKCKQKRPEYTGFQMLKPKEHNFLLLLLLRVDTYFSPFSSNQWTD